MKLGRQTPKLERPVRQFEISDSVLVGNGRHVLRNRMTLKNLCPQRITRLQGNKTEVES